MGARFEFCVLHMNYLTENQFNWNFTPIMNIPFLWIQRFQKFGNVASGHEDLSPQESKSQLILG